jgi:hypothetical protein
MWQTLFYYKFVYWFDENNYETYRHGFEAQLLIVLVSPIVETADCFEASVILMRAIDIKVNITAFIVGIQLQPSRA